MALGSASEYDPRRTAALQHPLMGFCFPSTLEASGSDLHRVCLARLCSAFRLSQPPDGLLLPRPSGFISRRWRPWDLPLQRFVPPTQPTKPLDPSSPLDVACDRACLTVATEPTRSPESEPVRPWVAPKTDVLRRTEHVGTEWRLGPRCSQRPATDLAALRRHRCLSQNAFTWFRARLRACQTFVAIAGRERRLGSLTSPIP
jgi:hypothetical protein